MGGASPTFLSGHLGCWGKRVDLSRHAIVEPSSEGNDNVRSLDGDIGIRTPVHVQTLLARLVKCTETLQSCAYSNVANVCAVSRVLVPLGRQDPISSVDYGILGCVDHRSGLLDERHIDRNSTHLQRVRGQAKVNAWVVALKGRGDCGDILRQIDENGAWSSRGSNFECFVYPTRKLVD